MFTEIEPRRWDIGVSAPRTVSPVLRPLQTQSDSASAGADGKRDNLSIYNTATVVESVMSATLPVVASTQEVIGTAVPAISAVLLGTGM